MSNYGEPWTYYPDDGDILDNHGNLILSGASEHDICNRIVNCINACEGIPTEELQICNRSTGDN